MTIGSGINKPGCAASHLPKIIWLQPSPGSLYCPARYPSFSPFQNHGKEKNKPTDRSKAKCKTQKTLLRTLSYTLPQLPVLLHSSLAPSHPNQHKQQQWRSQESGGPALTAWQQSRAQPPPATHVLGSVQGRGASASFRPCSQARC